MCFTVKLVLFSLKIFALKIKLVHNCTNLILKFIILPKAVLFYFLFFCLGHIGSPIMYQCFLEIAFEAELNTQENAELLDLAKELCNENPITRTTAISELRQMIYGKS